MKYQARHTLPTNQEPFMEHGLICEESATRCLSDVIEQDHSGQRGVCIGNPIEQEVDTEAGGRCAGEFVDALGALDLAETKVD